MPDDGELTAAALYTKRGTRKAQMKNFKALLMGVILLGLVVGCKTTRDENLMEATGFRRVQSPTFDRVVAKINSMPPDQITRVQHAGQTYYIFPDAKNRTAYIGDEQSFRRYQQMRAAKNLPSESLAPIEVYNADVWGPWPLWWK
jgi:hypothetical protein